MNNKEILNYMKEQGFTEQEIKNFELKMLLSQDKEEDSFWETESQLSEAEIVSFEEYFNEI